MEVGTVFNVKTTTATIVTTGWIFYINKEYGNSLNQFNQARVKCVMLPPLNVIRFLVGSNVRVRMNVLTTRRKVVAHIKLSRPLVVALATTAAAAIVMVISVSDTLPMQLHAILLIV